MLEQMICRIHFCVVIPSNCTVSAGRDQAFFDGTFAEEEGLTDLILFTWRINLKNIKT